MSIRIPISHAGVAAIMLAASGLAACSRAAVPPAKAAAPVPATAELSTPQTACWLLPADVAGKILGEPLDASAELGAIEYGNTSCNYYARGKRPGKDAPRLTLTLDWNGFNLMAMHIPKVGPATAAAPYADIGDGTLQEGRVLFVRVGKRSLAIDLRHPKNLHAAAVQLVAAVAPKM